MKKDSYAFLIPLIVGGLALIFGFVVWSIKIYRVTFLTVLGEQYLAAGTLLLPLVAMVIFIAKRVFKDKPSLMLSKCISASSSSACRLPFSSSLPLPGYWAENTLPGANLTGMNPEAENVVRGRQCMSRNSRERSASVIRRDII